MGEKRYRPGRERMPRYPQPLEYTRKLGDVLGSLSEAIKLTAICKGFDSGTLESYSEINGPQLRSIEDVKQQVLMEKYCFSKEEAQTLINEILTKD